MSGNIDTREFSINDYDAAIELWQRVEGVEIAEGDDRENIAQFLVRNPGLSRVATDESRTVGVALCGHDGRRGHIYHLAVDPAYQGADSVSVCWMNAWRVCAEPGSSASLSWWPTITRAAAAFGRRCGWEDIPGAISMGIDV